MRFKRIKALAFLGMHFTLHFFRRLFRINRRSKQHFIDSYTHDGIFALTPEQRVQISDHSRCLYCKLCDAACPELANSTTLQSPSYIVGTFSRSLTDYRYFEVNYSCADCAMCEQICPQHIPIRNIIDFMKSGKQLTHLQTQI